MHEMEVYRPSALTGRERRENGRAMARYRGNQNFREVQVDDQTDLTISKVENFTMATGAALNASMKVSKALAALEQMDPAASPRLNLIADGHSLSMLNLLSDLERRMRRI